MLLWANGGRNMPMRTNRRCLLLVRMIMDLVFVAGSVCGIYLACVRTDLPWAALGAIGFGVLGIDFAVDAYRVQNRLRLIQSSRAVAARSENVSR